MVDYYSVGMIIKQLFEKEEHQLYDSRYTQNQNHELNNAQINNSTKVTALLMHKIISGLIS
jgi:hypothetical protein